MPKDSDQWWFWTSAWQDSDQWWFWTSAWQDMEAETDEELRQGLGTIYLSDEEFLASFNEDGNA
jgi:hypothetical protein